MRRSKKSRLDIITDERRVAFGDALDALIAAESLKASARTLRNVAHNKVLCLPRDTPEQDAAVLAVYRALMDEVAAIIRKAGS